MKTYLDALDLWEVVEDDYNGGIPRCS
ncbi:hypothetical protein A2U01_0073534, partial [Trifolium medium]|nr:hypothetical protein [Trifolium medium]